MEKTIDISKDDLENYATIVHGIKGSSGGICADECANVAEALEKAALSGDYDYIIANNAHLLIKVQRLVADINEVLNNLSIEDKKPKKNKPDSKTLNKLLRACKDYEMSNVDAALDELEIFDYKTDNDLIVWLRENVEQMNFDEIIKRLS